MNQQDFADLAAGIKDSVTTVAIIIGGLWALGRFWRERESVPRLQFDLELNVVERSDTTALLNIAAHIENKGKVRHEISKLDFEISVFTKDQLEALAHDAACIPPEPVVSGSLMPAESEYTFIEPGVKASYFDLVALNTSGVVAYAYSRFDYGKNEEYHEAECTVSISRQALDVPRQAGPQRKH